MHNVSDAGNPDAVIIEGIICGRTVDQASADFSFLTVCFLLQESELRTPSSAVTAPPDGKNAVVDDGGGGRVSVIELEIWPPALPESSWVAFLNRYVTGWMFNSRLPLFRTTKLTFKVSGFLFFLTLFMAGNQVPQGQSACSRQIPPYLTPSVRR